MSCTSNKGIFETDYQLPQNLRLKDAVGYEKQIGSVDKTPNNLISISAAIYPNENNYELATPRTFIRNDGYFEVQVKYYYSIPDSSVKVTLYEWQKKDRKTVETKKELKNKFNQFKNQWLSISKELNDRFGLPIIKLINSDKYGNKIIEDNQSIDDIISSIEEDPTEENTAWKDEMKWESNSVHAYLFMFGDNRTGYRQIRLVFYDE